MSAPRHGASRLAMGDIGAEERDEGRQRDRQTLPACLEDVAELVHEDQEHEAEAEPPAVEPERVGGKRDEEGEELREPAGHDGKADEPVEKATPLLGLRAHEPRPIHSSPPA